jgi:hypothetical protein
MTGEVAALGAPEPAAVHWLCQARPGSDIRPRLLLAGYRRHFAGPMRLATWLGRTRLGREWKRTVVD